MNNSVWKKNVIVDIDSWMNPIPPPPPLYFTYENTHAYSLTKWLLVVFDECMWHWIFDDIIFFFLYVWIPNFCVCVHYKVVQSTMYLLFYPISTRTCIWINLWHVYHAGFFLYRSVFSTGEISCKLSLFCVKITHLTNFAFP